MLLERVENEDFYVFLDDLRDTKWKFLSKASKILIFNSDQQLIASDHQQANTGTWQYIEHSNLLLLNFEDEEQTKHLIYSVVLLYQHFMVLSPHQIEDDEGNPSFEIYYSSKKKPKIKELEEQFLLLQQNTQQGTHRWVAGLLLLLLVVLYFVFVY